MDTQPHRFSDSMKAVLQEFTASAQRDLRRDDAQQISRHRSQTLNDRLLRSIDSMSDGVALLDMRCEKWSFAFLNDAWGVLTGAHELLYTSSSQRLAAWL